MPAGVKDVQTPLEVLQASKALLTQEGRWLQGDVYSNVDKHGFDRYEDPDPYCGDWKVCASGAVFAVAVGFSKASGKWVPMGQPLNTPRSKLYRAAIELLDSVTPQDQREAIFAPVKGAPHTDIVWVQDYNDFSETKLADILAVFDAAIHKAQTEQESG